MAITATFEIEILPNETPLLPGIGRFDFNKVWSGDMEGISSGVMLSAGDPANGVAGYVAMEVFKGSIAGKRGTVALQQFGTMDGGGQGLRYVISPGSGTDELAGAIGVLNLTVDEDTGEHSVLVELGSDR